MDRRLVPCLSCRRHVRVADARCPFCAAPIEGASSRAIPEATRRLSRGAVFVFASSIAVGCGGSVDAPATPDAANDGSTTDGAAEASSDTGPSDGTLTDTTTSDSSTKDTATTDTATTDTAATDTATDTCCVAPPYGLPADSGIDDAEDEGGAGPEYGAPPPP